MIVRRAESKRSRGNRPLLGYQNHTDCIGDLIVRDTAHVATTAAAMLKEKFVQFFGKMFSRRTLLQDQELLMMVDFRQGTGLDTLTAFLVLSDQNNLKIILTGLSNGNMSAIIQIHTIAPMWYAGSIPILPRSAASNSAVHRKKR
jgi:hypothetical protein